jgi:hypothetical protein
VRLGDPTEAGIVKSYEETMRILEAFDLTGSYRAAADLTGCDHHTVARCVAARDGGRLASGSAAREHVVDPFLEKIEEWVERSGGKVRGDIAHDRLTALGYAGSERSTRRAVAAAKRRRKLGTGRVYRPWVPEPGMWFQYDFGDGPRVEGRATQLFCAWLAWCRYRVILPMWDKALPTVVACIDTALRRFGGVPTYGLTDNEKTVTIEHVAGIAIRNPLMVAAMHHYGLTLATCVVADPEAKGGSESTVRIAKADVVPTDANLREGYATFAELEAACAQVCDAVNGRPHRITRRIPAEMLLEEQPRLHRLPAHPYTIAFGESRTVGRTTPMVDVDCCQYSAPHELRGEAVWVREHGDEIVVVHVGPNGPREVARHQRTTPGNPRIDERHFPPQPAGPLQRTPAARSAAEAAFLDLGMGAREWLTVAGSRGVPRVRAKMARAVALAKLVGVERVDWALGHAAVMERFADADLESIVDHEGRGMAGARRRASEAASLQRGTAAWEGFGQ